jgi:hypothetical protein
MPHFRWSSLHPEGTMGSGLAIFFIFFGIALLDALRGGQWWRVLFWLAIGSLFYLANRLHSRRESHESDP